VAAKHRAKNIFNRATTTNNITEDIRYTMDSRASQLMMRESDVFYDHHPQQVEELQRVEEESKTVDYR
jgi:hypothetical protein